MARTTEPTIRYTVNHYPTAATNAEPDSVGVQILTYNEAVAVAEASVAGGTGVAVIVQQSVSFVYPPNAFGSVHGGVNN